MTTIQVVSGFAATFASLVKGECSLPNLVESRFYFGCSRNHVLSENRWPHEVTWFNKTLPKRYRTDKEVDELYATVSPEAVDENIRPLVRKFLDLLAKADQEGRISWHSSREELSKLHPETEVLCNGRVVKAATFRSESTGWHEDFGDEPGPEERYEPYR